MSKVRQFDLLSDATVKAWFETQIAYRNMLSEHCEIDSEKIAYDSGVNSIMIYSLRDMRRIAKILGCCISITENTLNDRNYCIASFEYEGYKINCFSTISEVVYYE